MRIYISIECVRSLLKRILKVERCRAAGPDQPRALRGRPLRDHPLVGRTPQRGRDACKQSTLGGFVPPWNRSFSMETADEQSSVWRIMMETLETGIAPPRLPALAEVERRTEEPLAQPAPCSGTQPAPLTPPRRQPLCCPPRNHYVGQRSPSTLYGSYATDTRSTASPEKPCAPLAPQTEA